MSKRELKKRVQAAILRVIDPMEELPFLADLPIAEAERVIEEFIAEVQEECYQILSSLDDSLLSMLTPPVLYATYRQHGVSLSRETLLKLCEEILFDEAEIVCDVDMELVAEAEEEEPPHPYRKRGSSALLEEKESPEDEEDEQKMYLVTMTL
jgi:hypothetical protein